MRKIVILGGHGFVGKNIALALSKKNIKFIQISRKNGPDLRNYDLVADWFKNFQPEIIINCAAHVGSLNYVSKQAAEVLSDNSRMILNMYEAVAKFCNSCIIINPVANCAYPAIDETFCEDSLWNGPLHQSVLAYGGAKRFLLLVAKSYEMQFGIKSINLLVPNMYGPYDSTDPNKAHALNALIARFVKAEKENRDRITLWGTGIAIREWLYAEDFGRIIEDIVLCPNMLGLSEPLNIAQNFGISVKELATIISSYFKNKISIKWDYSMPDGVPKKVMNDTRFRKIFNTFSFRDINEGIEETILYYRNIDYNL